MTGIARVLLAAVVIGLPAGATAQAVGDRAPVVTIKDLDGRAVTLAPAAGRKAMVLEFWATWCEVCEALLPRMRAAHARYGDRVEFIGVNVTVNESRNRVKRFVGEQKLPFRTVFDEGGVAVRAFAAPATSYVVIVDARGMIRYVGSGSTQDITGELARVIGS